MRVVLVSDLHPDCSTAGYPRFFDVKNALFHAVRHAKRVKADAFVFAGDLITNDPSLDLATRCVELLKDIILQLAPQFSAIPGNHDVFEDGLGTTVLDSINYRNIFKTPTYDRGIGYLPFTPSSHRYDPEEACRAIKNRADDLGEEVKLIVGHLNVEGIAPGSETTDFPRGRDVFFPIDEAKKLFPNAVLCNGHYHRRQMFKGVQIIGSLVPLTKGEINNEPGFLQIDV